MVIDNAVVFLRALIILSLIVIVLGD